MLAKVCVNPEHTLTHTYRVVVTKSKIWLIIQFETSFHYCAIKHNITKTSRLECYRSLQVFGVRTTAKERTAIKEQIFTKCILYRWHSPSQWIQRLIHVRAPTFQEFMFQLHSQKTHNEKEDSIRQKVLNKWQHCALRAQDRSHQMKSGNLALYIFAHENPKLSH